MVVCTALELALLRLPVRPESDLVPCCRRVLALRPELLELILPVLGQRFAGLSNEEIMATIGISRDSWRHTRAFQEDPGRGLARRTPGRTSTRTS